MTDWKTQTCGTCDNAFDIEKVLTLDQKIECHGVPPTPVAIGKQQVALIQGANQEQAFIKPLFNTLPANFPACAQYKPRPAGEPTPNTTEKETTDAPDSDKKTS